MGGESIITGKGVNILGMQAVSWAAAVACVPCESICPHFHAQNTVIIAVCVEAFMVRHLTTAGVCGGGGGWFE